MWGFVVGGFRSVDLYFMATALFGILMRHCCTYCKTWKAFRWVGITSLDYIEMPWAYMAMHLIFSKALDSSRTKPSACLRRAY